MPFARDGEIISSPRFLTDIMRTIAGFDEISKFVYTEEPPGRMVRQVLQDLLGRPFLAWSFSDWGCSVFSAIRSAAK